MMAAAAFLLVSCGNDSREASQSLPEKEESRLQQSSLNEETSKTQAKTKAPAKTALPKVVQDGAVEPANPCMVAGAESLPPVHLRAVGTEPFWGARIEGRCVTYSHPDDQSGTRVWTRFSGTAQSGVWSGAYEGKPFVLRTRAQAGCSDGMSDRRYPIAVTLSVQGEERHGCAEPL